MSGLLKRVLRRDGDGENADIVYESAKELACH